MEMQQLVNMTDTLLLAATRRSWRLRRMISFVSHATLGSTKLRIPVCGGLGLDHLTKAIAEPWMERIIQMALEAKPGMFIDVGANDGGTLLHLLSAFPDADYMGFEPLPMEYAYVQSLIAENALVNAKVFPVALSDTEGIATLLVSSSRASSSIVEGFRSSAFYSGRVPVVVSTGDHFVRQVAPSTISLIKIDVEGAELGVLKGFSATLSQYRPFVVFEVLPHRTAQEALRTQAVDDFLRGAGYKIKRIAADGTTSEVDTLGRKLPPGIEGTKADWDDSNYLATPAGFSLE